MVGNWGTVQPGSYNSTEGLLDEMDYCGINEALVYHSFAKYHSPAVGNRMLVEQITSNPRLSGCWVLLPSETGEMPSPTSLVGEMLTRGVRAARLFPTHHRLILHKAFLGELMDELEKHKVPLFIDSGNVHWSDRNTDWEWISETCLEYPELPLVLLHEGLAVNRVLFPSMKKFKNLYMEISYYYLHRGIEKICKEIGAGQLLFGTGMPVYAPGSPIMSLAYSNIGLEEKTLIAGGNLRYLLGGVR
jgi:hypothetical protein